MKHHRSIFLLSLHFLLIILITSLSWGATDTGSNPHGIKACPPDNTGLRFEYDSHNNPEKGAQLLTDYLAVFPTGPLQIKIKSYTFRYDQPGAGPKELTVTSAQTTQPIAESALSRVVSIEDVGFIGAYHVAKLKLFPRQTLNIGEQANITGEFTKLELEIPNQSLPGSALSVPAPQKAEGIEAILKRTLINYPEAASLRGFPKLAGINNPEDYPGLPFPEYLDASVPRLKLILKKNGIYTITPRLLESGNLGNALNHPEKLQLYHQGKEYALYQVTADKQAGKNTPLCYFYGETENSIYSEEGVYWLVLGKENGLRAADIPSSEASNTQLTSNFRESIKLEENLIPEDYNAMPNGDHWFWETIFGNETKSYALNIQDIWQGGLFQPAPADPVISIGFFGSGEAKNNEENRVYITFNSTTIAYGQWKAKTAYTLSTSFPLSLLKEGENQVQITLLNNSTIRSEIELDSIQVEYTRSIGYKKTPAEITLGKLQSIPGQFRFQLGNGQSGEGDNPLVFSVQTGNKGFSFSRILPVSNLNQYEASLDSSSLFFAGNPDTFSQPSIQIVPLADNLRATGKPAEVIYVTHPDFIPALLKLADYRKEQGFITRIASVQDIYNQFNYGQFDPRAIQKFFQYQAYFNGLPEYAALVGDANWDYKDRQKTGTPVYVPSYRGPDQSIANTDNGGNEDYFVSVIGSDPCPDIISGRISVSTLSEMSAVVDKVIAQDTASELSPWRIHALIATDDGFEADGREAAKNYLPLWMIPDYLFQQDYPYLMHQKFPKNSGRRQVPKATDALVDRMSKSSPFMCYIGHGGGGVWSHERLFLGGGNLHGSDILRIHNPDRNLFIYTMSCMNGYYDFPNPPWQSIATEDFLRARDGGTIGMLVPMGKGGTGQHLELGKGMADSFFKYGNPRLGDAIYQGKLDYYLKTSDYAMAQQYFLMGDPLANNALPEGRIQMAVTPRYARKGEMPSLKVTGIMPANLQNGLMSFYGHNQKTGEAFLVKDSVAFSGGKFSFDLKPGKLTDNLVFRAYAWNKATRKDGAGAVELPVSNNDVEFAWVKGNRFVENTIEIKLTNKLPLTVTQSELRTKLLQGKKDKDLFTGTIGNLPAGAETTLRIQLPSELEPGIYGLQLALNGKLEGMIYSTQTDFTIIPNKPAPGAQCGWRDGDISLNSKTLCPGKEINLKVSLYNYGNQTINSYPYTVKLKPDLVLSSGTIDNWLPMTEKAFSFRDKIPADYLLEKSVAESQETLLLDLNGKTCFQSTFTLKEAPDLVLKTMGIRYSPDKPEQSESIFFTLPVTNQGGTASEGITLNGYDALTVDGTKLMGNSAVYPAPRLEKLEPGETGYMKLRWDPAPETYGIHTVFFIVDPGNSLPDKNRLNQSGYAIVTILQNADLALDKESVQWEPKEFKAGDTVKVSVTLKNLGQMPALTVQPWGIDSSRAFDVSFLLQNTQGKSTTLSKFWISVLPAGQSTTLSASFMVPADTSALQLKTDTDNEVLELIEEENNQVTVDFKPKP
jgi:hypothetical protein